MEFWKIKLKIGILKNYLKMRVLKIGILKKYLKTKVLKIKLLASKVEEK